VSQTITPELRRWIVDQVEAGCTPEALLQSMAQSGWKPDVAAQALDATLTEHLAQRGIPIEAVVQAETTDEVLAIVSQSRPIAAGGDSEAAVRSPSRPSRTNRPGPHLGDSPRQVDVGDRQVNVLLTMARPRVVVLGGFLSDDECDALVAAASPRMARSLTVETHTGGEAVNEDRTSQGMFFKRAENDVVARVEARIARLLHWPQEKGEGLQVLHYRPGAEYKPHYDYFDPDAPGTATILKRGGQRVGTLVMYLNNPERGGGTTFPDVGLEVAPQKGNAVFFGYDRPHPGTQTLHGGAPVLAGEKWVATKWLREGEFA
jgi:prolyl 4-hydroxylase